MTIATDKLKRDLATAQAARVDAEGRKRRAQAAAADLVAQTATLLDMASRATPDPSDTTWSDTLTAVTDSSTRVAKTKASY